MSDETEYVKKRLKDLRQEQADLEIRSEQVFQRICLLQNEYCTHNWVDQGCLYSRAHRHFRCSICDLTKVERE